MYILNNTFAFPNPNRVGQIVIAGATDGLVIANNIFYQPNTAGIWFDAASGGTWAGALVENNLSTNAIYTPRVLDVTAVSNMAGADPKFVSPARFDFHLQTGSPAINAGLTLPQVTGDFEGVTRRRAGLAVGAYEFK